MLNFLKRLEQHPFVDFTLCFTAMILTYLAIIVVSFILSPFLLVASPFLVVWVLWKMVRRDD